MYTNVLDFLEGIQVLKSADRVWQQFMSFSGNYGLQFGGLADLPGPGEKLEDTTICLSWPEEWRQRYFDKGYLREDPAHLHLSKSADPYTWSETLACPDYTKQQKRIVREASEFGMHEGLLIPLLGLGTGVAMISIAGSNRQLSLKDRAELQLAAIYAHAQIRAVSKRRERPAPVLSAREREVLQWAAVGKSDWEIGEILKISVKTANAHMEHIKRKFGVKSRVQAVVKGINCRAIHI